MRAEITVTTTNRKAAGVRRAQTLAAIAAVAALAAWASYASTSATGPAHPRPPTNTRVLRSLTRPARQYVLGILSLTPAQLRAAFGTSLTSVPSSQSGSASPVTTATSRPPALPILPACVPGPCWRAATNQRRPSPHPRRAPRAARRGAAWHRQLLRIGRPRLRLSHRG